MEKKLKIIEITFVKTSSTKVKARADVHFDGFILKGFKIFQDEITKKEYVTPPSYLSPAGWRPLFKTDFLEDWQEIQRRILEEFNTQQMKESLDERYERK